MNFFTKSPRALTQGELSELRELSRCAKVERYKAETFRLNTGFLSTEKTQGQEIAAVQDKIASVLEQTLRDFMAAKLAELGYAAGEQVSIDTTTGKIVKQSSHA